jgi:pimeloyl-ACP methyl ester carboxylesterase
LASSPTDHRFASFDGQEIAWRELGEGRPVVLLHGLFSHAEMNWLRWGTAQTVADAGFRVIMPEFRAHGASAAPHDEAAYPADVLARDVEALVAHLDLVDFDLGGYSLGARTAVRLLVRGLRPRRAVLAGMGLQGIVGSNMRTGYFLRVIAGRHAHERGSPEWTAAQFMKTTGVDPDAVAHVLRAQAQTAADDLGTIPTPTLVVCGADDHDNGSAPELAAALPNATYVEIPGTHMSSVTRPELGRAIGDFLAA